jgi:hypothetical protein
MNRVVAALVVLTLVVAPVAGVASAFQDDDGSNDPTVNETATTQNGWSPPGPYTREQLRKPGAHDPEAPASIRMLGDPVRGGLGIRYKPAKPMDDEWEWLEPGSTVRTDRLQVRSTAFGDATGEYDLVVVHWEEDSTRVQTEDGTVQRQYAANQSVQRITLNLESGYTNQWIELQSVFGGEKRVSMWLERDGDPVSGARWQFNHETNPLAQAPASPITSRGDLWSWAFITILGPTVPGILLGRYAAQHVLSRTVIGTQRGVGFWLGILTIFLLVGLSVAWWQLSVIAAYLPGVAFLLLTGVAFIGYLGFRDDEVERAVFEQKDLESTKSVTGDDSKTARSEHIRIRDIVRRDGKIWMPAKGIRPMIARYWANPAEVDESDLKTLNDTEGDVSKKFEIDPGADYVLKHRPAHLSFDPTLTRALTTDELHELAKEEAQLEEMHPAVATVMAIPLAFKRFLKSINWRFVTIAVGGFAVIYGAVTTSLGLPYIGGLLGTIPGLIAGTRAYDGTLDFVEAPYHFSDARAVLVHERKTYEEAKTFEALEERFAEQDLEGLDRMMDLVDIVRDEMTGKFDELLGPDQSPRASESNNQTGVADD